MKIKPLPKKYYDAYSSLFSHTPRTSRNVLTREVKEYVKRYPNCKGGWLMLGDLSSWNERNLNKYYNNAIALDPGDLEANVELARLIEEKNALNKQKVEHYLVVALDTLVSNPDHVHASYYLEQIVVLANSWRLRTLCKKAIEIGTKYRPKEQDWKNLLHSHALSRRRVLRQERAKGL